MITMVGNSICKDCRESSEVIEREHLPIVFHDMEKGLDAVREYLKIREENPALYEECKRENQVGIPVFVLEDGTLTLDAEEAYAAARKERESKPTIRMYGSHLCRFCRVAESIIEAEELPVELHDITENLNDIKEFLKIRETHPELYDDCRKNNRVGIPVFILKDGTVTKDMDAAIAAARREQAAEEAGEEKK